MTINFLCFVADKPQLAVTFFGQEYLTYNLAQSGIDPILSMRDHISLVFKTRRSSGLLFFTGQEA